jgi:hypothetical protein
LKQDPLIGKMKSVNEIFKLPFQLHGFPVAGNKTDAYGTFNLVKQLFEDVFIGHGGSQDSTKWQNESGMNFRAGREVSSSGQDRVDCGVGVSRVREEFLQMAKACVGAGAIPISPLSMAFIKASTTWGSNLIPALLLIFFSV